MVDVLIIAGSKSDEAVVEKAAQVLKELKIEYTVEYASAHREPDRVRSIVESSDARVIIAIAGLSAALPGFISSLTTRPVIGVPVSAALGGLDALLSIVQMPKGVPVATVGIDNGANAAHLAARILNVTQADRTVPRTYAEAGVDTARVAQTHRLLGEYVRRSFEGHGVVEDFGHYANVVRVSPDLSVALTTDGVGSKVLLAQDMNRYDTIGQDCVAMNVNDLICVGADPIGFVDYLACDRPLPEAVIRQIAEGLLEGCKAADIPILGGETAILPELIHSRGSGNFDLAGAAMGIVHPDRIIDGSRIEDGDVILGVASTGLHSNGYTLARKVLGRRHSWREQTDWGTVLGEELLMPTRIYVPHFRALKRASEVDVRGIAHITGTAFKKLFRLKKTCFRFSSFPDIAPIFRLIQEEGCIEDREMFTTFNMGIGLVVVVSENSKRDAIRVLGELDRVYELGHIQKSDTASVVIEPYGVTIT